MEFVANTHDPARRLHGRRDDVVLGFRFRVAACLDRNGGTRRAGQVSHER